MRSRLFYKVFATYLVVTVTSVFVVSLLVGREVKKSSTKSVEEELTACARVVDLSMGKDMETKVDRLASASRSRVTLIDALGNVIVDSERAAAGMENHLNRPEIQEARVKGKGSAVRFSSTVGVDMLYVAVPIKEGGYVRLARPLYEVKQSIDNIYRSFFTAILLVIPLSLLAAFVFSYRLTSPIKAMEVFTEKLRRGEVSGSLLVKTTDEVKQLADNINYLVAELQEKIRVANEEKGKLVAAFASMTEGVLILDGEGRIEVYNRALREMFSPRYGDVQGKTLIEAFRNVDLQNAFDRFKKTGGPVTEEVTMGTLDPAILDVSISSIPGEAKTMIVFHDVTRLKKLEKMRVDFVANVTHEIRTPLTAILGFIETLQEGAIEQEETAKKFLEIISRHARRLNRLVEDLLTLSNIELGEMKFFFESVSLSGVVENVLPVVAARAEEKKITIVKEIPEGLPPVRADRDRLVQILLNILDNAVKFTPASGKITLSAAVEGDDYVLIRVEDTGIGVPVDEIPRLGERFYRVDKTRSREMGGTGLGLSIVKHLMAAHGGRMEIESHLGKGTIVSLLFPIMKEPASRL
ncbi:MAG: PAS domain-containing protein [Syntrophobacterales bacterium]|nr:PAS domain-containing protein [Syntrophobacterales bacterium]